MTKELGAMRRSAVVRALDQAGGAMVRPVRPVLAAVRRPAVREMSVRAALEWAFAVERVALNFDDTDYEGQVGVDTIWRLMQRGALGCKVDGGGRSLRHDDAEVIASMVSALPVGVGGRGMAVQVAWCAATLGEPDWMAEARVRCVPRAWKQTRHGWFAKTESVGRVETVYRGRKTQHDVLVCPVTYTPSRAQIDVARRAYLGWYGALLHLQVEMRTYGLRSLRVTQDMPVLSPWRTTG